MAVASIANNGFQKQSYWLFGKQYKLQVLDKKTKDYWNTGFCYSS